MNEIVIFFTIAFSTEDMSSVVAFMPSINVHDEPSITHAESDAMHG